LAQVFGPRRGESIMLDPFVLHCYIRMLISHQVAVRDRS